VETSPFQKEENKGGGYDEKPLYDRGSGGRDRAAQGRDTLGGGWPKGKGNGADGNEVAGND